MIMDVGRSSFRKWFMFFAPIARVPVTGPVRPLGAIGLGTPRPWTRVLWYVAPEGALVFPTPHIWGSSAFYDDYEKAGQVYGEYPYEQRWSNGATPMGATGQHFCGKLSDFTTPAVWPSNAGPARRSSNGLMACCGLPGAFVLSTPTMEGDCSCCDGVTPDSFSVQISAPGYPFDAIIMQMTRFPDAPCQWYAFMLLTPDLSLAFACDLDPADNCAFQIGFSYAVQPGGFFLINTGIVVGPPSFRCKPFGFSATMPILDHDQNPTGDYAIMTRI